MVIVSSSRGRKGEAARRALLTSKHDGNPVPQTVAYRRARIDAGERPLLTGKHEPTPENACTIPVGTTGGPSDEFCLPVGTTGGPSDEFRLPVSRRVPTHEPDVDFGQRAGRGGRTPLQTRRRVSFAMQSARPVGPRKPVRRTDPHDPRRQIIRPARGLASPTPLQGPTPVSAITDTGRADRKCGTAFGSSSAGSGPAPFHRTDRWLASAP